MPDQVRTSVTHPLMIAAVPVGGSLGRIGITFCPGKKQARAATGCWDRDLAIDVKAIAEWGAVVLVSLVEGHELTALKVEHMGEAARANHMDWLHLPIRDVSVPEVAFEDAWQRHGPGLRARLRAGFDVLVHCKGGLGRAGLVASRLLIDIGWAPGDALAAVRAVRPGAVETAEQVRYVLDLTPLAESPPAETLAATKDRAVGALLGLAVGDALGTTLEFSVRDSKPLLTNMVGGGPFQLKAGEWTDDTAMALALADSLVTNPKLDEADLMRRFVEWHRRGSYSCTGRCFDIGVTTRQALARFERDGNALAGSSDPQSAGNGSLMRLSPVAIRHWRDPAMLAGVAARQSRTTHAVPEAVDACVAFATMLADAIAGTSKEALLASGRSSRSRGVGQILGGSWRGKRRSDIASSGYVIHSLEAAIWCVARTNDFAAAVLLAANLGDDADTVAAITGQLAGALYGASGIPEKWLAKLAWRERLTNVAAELLA
jgi:ADP-ribosyl-[dinitrogen reductase] hydrolase